MEKKLARIALYTWLQRIIEIFMFALAFWYLGGWLVEKLIR